MRLLYNIFIHLYNFGICIASLFNEKAKLLRDGRKRTFEVLNSQCVGKKIIWLHAASLGEYEQGKPLIQKLAPHTPIVNSLLPFFPLLATKSRKTIKTSTSFAIFPADTPRNVRRFLDTVRPEAAFFVKYEYWFNFIKGLSDRKIPFYYLSAIYRKSQYFFKPYGRWFAQQLHRCNHFFVQNETSEKLLQSIGIKQVTVTGDTRFDRVFSIAQQNERLDFMEEFKGNSKLIVVGSSWQPDENVIQQIWPDFKNKYKLVIAPHVIGKEHITSIQSLFLNEKVILFSERNGQNLAEFDILIIDTIGLLSKIYKYADIAMVGGAFATGLHNTLEAAVFKSQFSSGPNTRNSTKLLNL